MFDQFNSSFQLTNLESRESNQSILTAVEPYAPGFSQLIGDYGGGTFESGLYRLHGSGDLMAWTESITAVFPRFANRLVCFAFDWLGRHFALDRKRVVDGRMQVLLLEPGAGEAMQVPADLQAFHNVELVEYRNDALASDFFSRWIDSGGAPPAYNQYVGYKVPLFLGGSDDEQNLELSDMDVYWTICGQLLNSSRGESAS
ncbi:hypothetical protein Pla123a_10560 [Posidoniimonas polymericola]|uniref:T6SS immunity protein Tdi1 C-terminal domain-containing protein n=1 Tax=Posidoniimonas polymericola TaxID=2528002 RepID=A0A5C5YTH2_9BACT|nr:T6SS immunity protein Tdi1 domain-containing protein [Posidoniimonas polymericola]TWT78265.1 hypothetical protein Pla123a_10560 [Posidoniimonas polymericola]